MSIFGKISGRTAEALLSEEKNAEYRALGAERLGDLAFSHANSLSAKADQGVLAAENETAACTIIKELQAIGQTCKQGLPTEETLVRMVELCLRYKVPIPSVPKWREELQGVQNPNKTSTRFLAEAATGTDVQLWAAKYPIGWRLNIGEYLRSMNLITEAVKSVAELQQQLELREKTTRRPRSLRMSWIRHPRPVRRRNPRRKRSEKSWHVVSARERVGWPARSAPATASQRPS